MPQYAFNCPKCQLSFYDLCRWEDREKVKCPQCQGGVDKMLTTPGAVLFKEPKGTSREDNFDYVAKWNYENNLNLRRAAEKAQKGKSPYKKIDDSRHLGRIE